MQFLLFTRLFFYDTEVNTHHPMCYKKIWFQENEMFFP